MGVDGFCPSDKAKLWIKELDISLMVAGNEEPGVGRAMELSNCPA
jgi:hypothetical protein